MLLNNIPLSPFLSKQQPIPENWGLTELSTKSGLNNNSQNMLVNLSNNLIAFQNSFKLQKIKPQTDLESTSNIKKRKILKRKIDFMSELQPPKTSFSNEQTDKQNKNQAANLQQINKNRTKTAHSASNLIKLEKMFGILKDIRTLNESILPYKVNLTKISQKRILASMVFKQFTVKQQKAHQKSKSIIQTNCLNNDQLEHQQQQKNTITYKQLPYKRRVFSLDIKDKGQNMLRKPTVQSNGHTNNIFTINTQSKTEFQIRKTRHFSRRKRSFSVRKPENSVFEKTIEQIRSNYSQIQMCVREKPQPNLSENQLKNPKSKQNEYFSDSRFFAREQNKNKIIRQGLSQISVLNINNCSKK